MPLKTSNYMAALLLCLSWYLSGIGPSLAQDNTPITTYDLFPAEEFVGGTTYPIDATYAENNDASVPAPFRFRAAEQDNMQVLLGAPTPGTGEIIKVNFATMDRQLIENMRFVNLDLSEVDAEDRQEVVGSLFEDEVFGNVVVNHPDNEFFGVRYIKIGDYDGVEAAGQVIDDDIGLIYIRLVGILNPNGPDSIVALINIVADRMPMENINDMARTFTGTALRYFEFIEE